MKKLTPMIILILGIGINLTAQDTQTLDDALSTTFRHPVKVEKGIEFGDGTVQTTATASKEELATVQVVNAVFDKTTEAIQQLSTALKVPAEHVYAILVKQQRVSAVSGVLLFIFFSIVTFLLIKIPLKDNTTKNQEYFNKNNPESSAREYYKHYDLDDGWWIWSISTGILFAIVLLITMLACGPNIVTGLLNPEYGAIKDIMSIL